MDIVGVIGVYLAALGILIYFVLLFFIPLQQLIKGRVELLHLIIRRQGLRSRPYRTLNRNGKLLMGTSDFLMFFGLFLALTSLLHDLYF